MLVLPKSLCAGQMLMVRNEYALWEILERKLFTKRISKHKSVVGNLTLVQRLLLYDFLEERDGQLVLPLDFVELLDLYSDDSDEWSDSETN